MLIPRHTIDLVGMLPEEYFMGIEEWDYSTAVLNAGLRILYVPDFTSIHKAGASYQPGHPILVVYNGVRGKQVFMERSLERTSWIAWRYLYWVYLNTYWRVAGLEEDHFPVRTPIFVSKPRCLHSETDRGVRRIELEELRKAGRELGTSDVQ